MGRACKCLVGGLLVAVLALLAACALALLLLQTQPGRAWLATSLSRILSEQLPGTLRVGKVLELGRVLAVADVEVCDPDGRPVLRIEQASATLELRTLLAGEIVLSRVEVARPWVSLHSHRGTLAIVASFAPPAARPGEKSASFPLTMRRVLVTRGEVVAAPVPLTIRDVNASCTFSLEAGPDLEIAALTAMLSQGADGRAELVVVDTLVHARPGERSPFVVTLRSGADHAELVGMLRWGREGPEHIDARLRTKVTAAGLGKLLGPQAAGMLGHPLELAMQVLVRRAAAEAFEIHLTVPGLRAFELAPPPFQARVDLTSRGVRLRSLSVPGERGKEGDVRADLAVSYQGSLTGMLELQLARPVHLGEATTLERLRASVALRGKVDAPVVSARLSAGRARVGGLSFEDVELTVRGGPRRYALNVTLAMGEVRARSRYSLERGQGEQRLSGSSEVTGLLRKPVRLELSALRMSARALEFDEATLVSGPASLVIRGRYGLTESSDLRATLRGLTLTQLLSELSLDDAPAIKGRVDGHLTFRGPTARPDLVGTLALHDVEADDRALGQLTITVALLTRARRLTMNMARTGASGDSLYVRAQGVLGREASVVERLTQARYRLSVRARQDLNRLAPLWRGLSLEHAPAGVVRVEGRFSGRLARLRGQLEAQGRGLRAFGSPPVDAELGLELTPRRTLLALLVSGTGGSRASLVFASPAPIARLLDDLTLRTFLHRPGSLEVAADIPRVDRLPGPWAAPLPMKVAVQASLTSSREAPPRASVSAQGSWLDDSWRGPGHASAPSLRVAGTLERSHLDVRVTGELKGQRAFQADVFGRAPVAEWVRSGNFSGDLSLLVDAAGLDLGALPGAMESMAGRLTASLRGQGLLGPSPRLLVHARVKELRVRGVRAGDLGLNANLGPREGELQVTVQDGAGTPMRVHARLPYTLRKPWAAEPNLAGLEAHASFSAMPLGLLLAAVPNISQPRGSLDGSVEVHGLGEDSHVRGRLVLKRAAFTLADPLTRVESLDATLALEPKALELSDLRWADQDGTLVGKGRLELQDFRPTTARATFRARSFPLRRDLVLAATVDGNLDVDADLTSRPRRARFSLRNLAVRLPDQGSRRGQELEEHPEVSYTDAKATEEPAPRERTPTPLRLDIDAREPFWVRHQDFAMQLAAELRVDVDARGTRLSGPVRIQRGFLNLLGKGFDLERGLLLFDGSEQVDPTVTIDAVHKLADGQTVTVKVRGRLSSPKLTFTSSVPGADQSDQALELLVTGSGKSATETAEAQVGAALAGMTAGLLSRITRTRVGKYVPVLALEAGASSGTRLRAGVQASRAIPPFLRGIVQGMYVEGFVGSYNQGGSRQGTGGVLVELYFPNQVVTGGTWEVPNNWSVEVTWEP